MKKNLCVLFAIFFFLIFPPKNGNLNFEVYSEAAIPTNDTLPTMDEDLWHRCCSHVDCIEASVAVLSYVDKDNVEIKIRDKSGDYEPFVVPAKDIHPSTNSKTYYCHYPVTQPPNSDNFRCAFIAQPNYTQNNFSKNPES